MNEFLNSNIKTKLKPKIFTFYLMILSEKKWLCEDICHFNSHRKMWMCNEPTNSYLNSDVSHEREQQRTRK